MTLEWRADEKDRIVYVRGSGTVTYDDLKALLSAIDQSGIGAYGKLVDLTKAEIGQNKEGLLMAGAILRAAHARRPIVGPLALVTENDVPSPVIGALAAADRRIRVFVSPGHARRWLRSVINA